MNKELILQTADKQWKISSINNGKYPLLGTVRPEVIQYTSTGNFSNKKCILYFFKQIPTVLKEEEKACNKMCISYFFYRYLQYLKKKKKHVLLMS